MSLSDLLVSAVTIVFTSMFLVVGISYLVYRIKNKSRYNI